MSTHRRHRTRKNFPERRAARRYLALERLVSDIPSRAVGILPDDVVLNILRSYDSILRDVGKRAALNYLRGAL